MAPERDKVLDICYLYNNAFHRVRIEEDDEHIVLPNLAHRQPATDWKRMDFDWPLDAEVTAEGSASYNVGVD